MFRGAITGMILIGVMTGSLRAQQQVTPSLAEVARQAEATKATVKKAKKTYTNADLSADARGEASPAPATPGGFVSASLGKAVSADEMLARSEEKSQADTVAQESEESWRGRATSLRMQIERLQKRLAVLTKPNPARDAVPAAVARNETEIANIQTGLNGLKKSWANLEESASTTKIPMAWIEPRPQF